MRVPETRPVKRLLNALPPSIQRFARRAVANRRDRDVINALSALSSSVKWETPTCAICGIRETRPHTTKNGFQIVECTSDGLLFVSPRPDDVTPYYDARYYQGGAPGVYQNYGKHAVEMKTEWADRLERVSKHVETGRRLLDVGAATGDFVALALSNGWKARGIELSEWAAEKARTDHRVDVLSGSLPDPRFGAGAFDLATMWDCIEHLSDPGAVLRAIRDALRDDGILALSTGAVEHRDPLSASGWYYPPWHLYYFSRETMYALLERTGFDVIDYIVHDPDSPYAIMIVIARSKTRQSD